MYVHQMCVKTIDYIMGITSKQNILHAYRFASESLRNQLIPVDNNKKEDCSWQSISNVWKKTQTERRTVCLTITESLFVLDAMCNKRMGHWTVETPVSSMCSEMDQSKWN